MAVGMPAAMGMSFMMILVEAVALLLDLVSSCLMMEFGERCEVGVVRGKEETRRGGSASSCKQAL